jgi:hypothetical protein
MTRFACLAAVCVIGLVVLPAEPQGFGPRGKGKGKAAAKAVQRPAPKAAPALRRPQVNRPAARPTPRVNRPTAPSRGFVPSRPAARPTPRVNRPTAPRTRPAPPTTRPQITRPPAAKTRPAPQPTRPTPKTNLPAPKATRPTAPGGVTTRPKAPGGITTRPTRPGGVTTRPDRPNRPPVTVPGSPGATRPRPGDRLDPDDRPGRPGVIDRTPGGVTRPDRDRPGRLDPDRVDRDRFDRDRPGGARPGPDRFDRDRFDRDRPRVINRPEINRRDVDRTDIDIRNRNVNRTDIDVRNRYTNRTNNVTVNRWGGGRQVGAPRSWYTEPRNWGRNWWGDRPAWYWGRPYYWHHSDWHHGYWNYWTTPPALWFGAGLLGGWLLSPGDTFVYQNPYYVAPTVVTSYLDYSVPLPVVAAELDAVALPPDPDALADPDAPPPAPADATVAEAYRLLDRARESFRAGQYAQAQIEIETAIRLVPSDPALHEVRALTLFAQAKYQEAAATLYAVLTAGPGWDWPTMRDMYPDVETYTAQLRALERFVAERPDAAYGHFLLAYHYLVTANREPAIRELRETVRVQPDDQLAQALLTSLTTADTTGATGPPPAPGR